MKQTERRSFGFTRLVKFRIIASAAINHCALFIFHGLREVKKIFSYQKVAMRNSTTGFTRLQESGFVAFLCSRFHRSVQFIVRRMNIVQRWRKAQHRKPLFCTGFTLLEVLLVVSILAILARIGVSYYRNTTTTIALDAAAQTLVLSMKEARGKAMGGDTMLKWGIHVVNGAQDYYETFSSSSTYAAGTVTARTYLPSTVIFTAPSEGVNADVIFSNIFATTSAQTITLSNNGQTKNLYVTTQGTIQ